MNISTQKSPLYTFSEPRTSIDWILFITTIPLVIAGLITMNSFIGDGHLFGKQLFAILVGWSAFFLCSYVDFRFLRTTRAVSYIFLAISFVLLLLFVLGKVSHGAQSWFTISGFAFQPSDPAKIVLIILLAKYFSRRHVEIAHIRHILVSGIYSMILFLLIIFQPDFGSAIIIFFIWLGMIFVSGVSRKHILLVFLLGALCFAGLWHYGFKEYQKDRIRNFIHPLADIHGSGYNAYQSVIAVGSGELIGKGLGYGTQSRLKFLPEYQTDFIFAAFAEEWGFIGVIILFSLYGLLIWRIVRIALVGATNFEILFGAGIAIYFIVHFMINVGMNIGLLPVTGITLPFLSYGGTHILTEYIALGMLMGMRRYSRTAHKDSLHHEFIGPQ